MSRVRTLALLTVPFLFFAGACGDDDDPVASSPGSVTTTVPAAGGTTVASAPTSVPDPCTLLTDDEVRAIATAAAGSETYYQPKATDTVTRVAAATQCKMKIGASTVWAIAKSPGATSAVKFLEVADSGDDVQVDGMGDRARYVSDITYYSQGIQFAKNNLLFSVLAQLPGRNPRADVDPKLAAEVIGILQPLLQPLADRL